MSFDFKNDTPIYIQIIEYIKTMIISKKYLPNQKLPSVRELSLFFEVNPNTIQKALFELENMELNLKDRFSKIPTCVENLIKLIKLRILATNASISLVRQAGNQIRIYTPFSAQEWIILKSKIESKYTKNITYSTPPKNLAKTKGILLVNKNEDDFDEIFNKLADLFYYISEVILNFKIN